MPKEDPDDYVCRQCAARNRTCCRSNPRNTANCFPLSEFEIDILLSLYPHSEVIEMEANTQVFIAHMRKLFPDQKKAVPKMFPKKGRHPRLKTYADGTCIFLGDKGCVLPVKSRPYFCRIYPFWVCRQKITVFNDPGCLALNQSDSIKKLLQTFAVSPEKILKLYHDMFEKLNCS
ncbi:MAG: YkgJ family cysteine cluster protein [Thermodesulfobacteriota bacterium]